MSPTRTIDLSGTWTLRDAAGGEAIQATVPGCVHLDLERAGRLPPLFHRDNELLWLPVCERDWVYERTFQADAALLACQRVLLRCDGLDTIAEVAVNGKTVLHADNMHRTWEADLRGVLVSGENRIAVTLRSPLPWMQRKLQEDGRPLFAWNIYDPRFAGRGWIRKMACAFGWDWGPMVPTSGIWRGIAVVAQDGPVLDEVAVEQRHRSDAVELAISTPLAAGTRLTACLELDGRQVAAAEGTTGAALTLAVSEPRLWWPNGMGGQQLYRLTVRLLDAGGNELDRWSRRIGLRTVALVRETDQWGESFAIAVNGRRIFAKGANWIPSSIFPSECGKEACRRNLRDAAAAGMNMIRAWGGGIYETDAFYDTCDELGLLVWQDLMFACGMYPVHDAAWRASVAAEVEDNARRLRHHASLALWCGNNEVEHGFVSDEWTPRTMSWSDYSRVFDVMLPALLRKVSPDIPYWPASAHSPHGDRKDFNNHRWGDAHAWSVWFGDQPFESQREWKFRFQSEFGFQSFPEPRTIESFTEPGDRNLTSYIMDLHQRSKSKGNRQIFSYLLDWFRMPKDFASQLWMTQLTQALCVQYAAEHTRRMQPRTEGCLYWQLNDMWPAATWSSIDCFGRWKALQHLARRFFAPVLVSGVEDALAGTVAIHLSNHRPDTLNATVRWRATDCAGRELLAGSAAIEVPSQADRQATVLDCRPLRTRLGAHLVHGDAPGPKGSLGMHAGDLDLLIWLEAEAGGEVLSRNLVLFARPKHLRLADDPGLTVAVAETAPGVFSATIGSAKPSLWNRVELDGEDASLSDNWFHLDGRTQATVAIVPARRLDAAEVRRRLRVVPLVANG